ncbi:MAG: hypothetical protein ACI4EI_05200 [Muricoprocola sp.]
MAMDEEIYDTPHYEDEVERRLMRFRRVRRIVEVACSGTIRNSDNMYNMKTEEKYEK